MGGKNESEAIGRLSAQLLYRIRANRVTYLELHNCSERTREVASGICGIDVIESKKSYV